MTRRVGALFAEDVVLGDVQNAAVLLMGIAQPLVERWAIDDGGRDAGVVKVEDRLRIDQELSAAGFSSFGFDRFEELAVLAKEIGLGIEIAFDEAVLYEEVARGTGVDGCVADTAGRNNREAEERDFFRSHRSTGTPVPMGIAVAAGDEVAGEGLDPFRRDTGGGPEIAESGFDHFSGDDPFGLRRGSAAAGPEQEFGAAARRAFVCFATS